MSTDLSRWYLATNLTQTLPLFSARWWKYEEASFKWSHTGHGGSHTRRGGPPPAHWRPPLTPPPRGVGLHAWCAETNFPAGINQAQQAAASAQQHCCFASSLAWEIPAVTAMVIVGDWGKSNQQSRYIKKYNIYQYPGICCAFGFSPVYW